MEHEVLSDLVQKCICCKQFTILGHPGSLTKLVEMPVQRWSGTDHSRTGQCPATNCCLGDCWTLFSLYNTKRLKIILYSTQKTLSGPLLRVAHYLTWYSRVCQAWTRLWTGNSCQSQVEKPWFTPRSCQLQQHWMCQWHQANRVSE